jgi:hypothetical protein
VKKESQVSLGDVADQVEVEVKAVCEVKSTSSVNPVNTLSIQWPKMEKMAKTESQAKEQLVEKEAEMDGTRLESSLQTI